MCDSHAALDGAGVRASGAPISPVGALENDRALGFACWAFVDLFAKGERVHVEFHGEIVNGLLEGEAALRVARCAEGSAGTCVDENVVLLGEEVGALVHVGRGACGSGSCADASGAVAGEFNCSEGAVVLCSDLQLLMRVGPVGDDVLLATIEHQFDGSVCLSRQVGRNDTFVACAELRTEAAAHVLGDDANFALG